MRADAQKNRQQLLAAARGLAQGERLPTLNELARQSGLGVATVYRHFPDAEALATALVEEPLAELQKLFERASLELESEPGAALRTLFVGALELELKNPLVARLIHAPETTSEPAQRAFQRMQVAARKVMARAQRAKLVRASITGEDLCRLLLGVHAAALGAERPIIAARRYADIVLAGLAVPAPRRPR